MQVGQQVAPPAAIFLGLFCFEGEIGVPLFGVALFTRCLRFDRPILAATCAMSGVRKFVFFGLWRIFFILKQLPGGAYLGGRFFFKKIAQVNLSGKSLR